MPYTKMPRASDHVLYHNATCQQ